MVEIQAPSSSRARSWRPSSASRARIRPRSSPAARSRVGDHEHRVDVEARVADGAHEALDEHRRLAGAGARGDEDDARAPRSPRAAPRSACSDGGHDARHPAHRPEVAPASGTEPPFGSCRTSPARIRATKRARVLARALDAAPRTRPRRGSRSAGSRAGRPRGLGAQQPARAALAGERAVEPAERLDPDEVAQHEHVERDLQPQLARRSAPPSARSCPTCSPARSRARRTGRRRSGRSSRVSEKPSRARARAAARAPSARSRTRPRSGAARAASGDSASSRTKLSRSRHRLCSSSRRCEVGELDPDAARERVVEAVAQEPERLVERSRARRGRRRAASAGPRRTCSSAWCATEPRSVASTSASIVRGAMSALDEPHRRAVGERARAR